jgi:hypothetical protein
VADLALISATSGCSLAALQLNQLSPPVLAIESHYDEPTVAGAAVGTSLESLPPFSIPVAKTVSGTTTTLGLALPEIANQGFNCALVETHEEAEGSLMVFPITAPPAPPTPPAPPPAPAPASRPVLAIAKSKPLKVKVGKSTTVKIKVSNTGATATAQGSLRVKAAKGVLVKPEVQKLPVLAPGASWTVSVRVQVTEKAKTKSTLSLVGTASGSTATSSLIVKRTE